MSEKKSFVDPEAAKMEMARKEAEAQMTEEEKKKAEELEHPYVVLIQIRDELKRIADGFDRLFAVAEARKPKTETKTVTTQQSTQPTKTVQTTVTSPAQTTPSNLDKRLEEVKALFPKDLQDMLIFDVDTSANFIKVKPRQYLGAENFSKIAKIVRDNGGMYVSQGKESHFRFPKTKQ